MSYDISKEQAKINREIDGVYARLEELRSNDGGVSAELAQLNSERSRYVILSELNDQLERLDKLGGADLFWGENYDRDSAQQQQARIHDLITGYDARVAELQSKQQQREDAMLELELQINGLNEDSIALQELEEELAEDFVIEREMVTASFRPMVMPWNGDDSDQHRFRKILLIVLFVALLFGGLIPLWELPIPDRIEVVEIPERLAKLVVAKKPPPPPPPVKQEKPEEKQPEKQTAKKEEKQPVKQEAKKARKKAERAGLMAFKDDFADLIDSTTVAKLGSSAKISGNGSKAKKTTRSLVTSSVGSGSSGINVASLSRNVGGAGEGMGGVEFSRVESSIGTDFEGEERPLSSGPGPSRTDEEIQIVFDRYKATLYRIYNRELRKNPTLQGKMVLRITIKADGSVAESKVDSSDMGSPELEKQIAARVSSFNFGAKDGVPTITILYPIDFLPAT